MALTEQQLEQRRNYVTGTDASIIMGVNPYQSVLELWQLKLGIAEPQDISDNPRVRAGNYLEPVVGKLFEDTTGKKLRTSEDLIVHPKHKWMGGNIDRYVDGEDAILEIKTASFGDGWGDQGENIIPKHYLCQCAHYMAICEVSKCYVAVLIGGWDFRTYIIQRNSRLEELLIEKEKYFWHENVKKEVMPEPRNLDDIVTMYRNQTIKEPAIADMSISVAVQALKINKNEQKILQLNEKELKDQIALYLKNKEVLLDDHGEIILTWKPTKDGVQFDTKLFAKENEALYKKYLKERAGHRRFLIKGESE